jgi:single-strand DNA-binding protein
MSSLNKVMLIGNLGRDPEIRSTQTGDRVANLSIATSERWTDKRSGEKREKTEWHRVVVFNDKLVDILERYVSKGSKVYLEGKLQTRKWQDQGGEDRFTTEIVLANFDSKLVLIDGRRGDNDNGGEDAGGHAPAQRPPAHHQDLDDDIPF